MIPNEAKTPSKDNSNFKTTQNAGVLGSNSLIFGGFSFEIYNEICKIIGDIYPKRAGMTLNVKQFPVCILITYGVTLFSFTFFVDKCLYASYLASYCLLLPEVPPVDL